MRDEEIKEVYYEDLKSRNAMAQSKRMASQTRSSLNNKKENIKLKRGRPKMIKVNYNEYISYKKFKELPEDLKRGYLQYIVDNNKVGYLQVATMWGGEVSKETLRKRFSELGIVRSIPEGCSVKREDKAAFLSKYAKPQKVRKVEESAVPEEVLEDPIAGKYQEIHCDHLDGSMTFKSKHRNLLEADFKKLLAMFDGDDTLIVRVTITRGLD